MSLDLLLLSINGAWSDSLQSNLLFDLEILLFIEETGEKFEILLLFELLNLTFKSESASFVLFVFGSEHNLSNLSNLSKFLHKFISITFLSYLGGWITFKNLGTGLVTVDFLSNFL